MSVTKDFYLARIAQCEREAGEAQLDNVRARCLRAGDAWRLLADRFLKTETERQRQTADKAAIEISDV
ncbi:hypothetical protein [Sphingobium sp.]|uniref:hypothetical protein n=1 Tax=Sphingobium sp. TaxID=1912891 RepID=UPI002C1B7369|nr:hypothetical protein [Sphingobium sp.]HUD94450.1 hypothetical protein [Sphingobium sp.]